MNEQMGKNNLDAINLVVLTSSPEDEKSIKRALSILSTDVWNINYYTLSKEQSSSLFLDWHDSTRLTEALTDVHTCIILISTDFNQSKESEVAQGMAIGKVCKATKVKHVIVAGQLHCEKTIGVPAKHYDAKAEICEYYRTKIEVPMTVLRIPPLYETFLTYLKPKKDSRGLYEIIFPIIGAAPIDMLAGEDVGYFFIPIIECPELFVGKTVSLSGDKVTGQSIAQVLNRVLPSKRFFHKQITIQEFRDMDFPGSIDRANMFEFLSRVDIQASPNATRELYPQVQSFSTWVNSKKSLFEEQLEA